MGGVFGKNRRPCVFPRVVFRAKGRRAARVCCDAATWTGESRFHSARTRRTARCPEPPAATMVLEASGSEFGDEEGDSASPPRAQHSEASAPVAARDTRGAELSQQPEGKPRPELLEPQELTGEAQGPQNPQESSEAAQCPPGSSLSPEPRCGEQGVTPLTCTTVEVDVHVSADHGEPGRAQAAAESELLRAAGQEAGGAGAAGDTCVGKALWEVPLQKAGDTTAALCPLEEPEPPLRAAEAGEDVADGQGAAQEQGGQETEAPYDLQLGQGEIGAPEGVEGAAGGAGQDEEVAEESPACLPETQQEEEEEEEIQISSEGEPEEH
ncbi:myristoylated alanine-rich C-kinase substrate-like [Agelaius tricolor]|uniref:myristoylated alanine-rich C-kinase substrate-like n=1 Tax=Agelaius tricolor TaxID=9191 RepID=UPI0039F1CDDA